MKIGYKVSLSIIGLLLITSIVLLSSYNSYLKTNIPRALSYISTSEKISVNYLDGKDYNLTNIKPNEKNEKNISITNVSNDSLIVSLNLMDIAQDNIGKLTLEVKENNKTLYNSLVFSNDVTLVKREIKAHETVSYNLVLTNNTTEVQKNFLANLFVYSDIYDSNNSDFSEMLINSGNLTKTMDESGEVYYYKGDVSNNYVAFNNMLWRILRVNGDGSIRIVLDNTIDKDIAYSLSTSPDYSDKLDYTKSNILKELNNWLEENNFDKSLLMEENYCSDYEVSSTQGEITYFKAYDRVTNNKLSLNCEGNSIKSTIGIPSIDDVLLTVDNNTSYLYNPSITNTWWTLSGFKVSGSATSVYAINKDGSLNTNKLSSDRAKVRPVINIKGNNKVLGTGQLNDPYHIN